MNSYVLAIIPSQEIQDFVDRYRKKYVKYTSYVIPPHITIYPPFYIKNSNEKEILGFLKRGFSGTKLKTVIFRSINFYQDGNNVIYFDPDEASSINIRSLAAKAITLLDKKVALMYYDFNFTLEKFVPHMTIAERIPNHLFIKIKKELEGFNKEFSFEISSVYFFKQKENSKIWKELQEISF